MSNSDKAVGKRIAEDPKERLNSWRRHSWAGISNLWRLDALPHFCSLTMPALYVDKPSMQTVVIRRTGNGKLLKIGKRLLHRLPFQGLLNQKRQENSPPHTRGSLT